MRIIDWSSDVCSSDLWLDRIELDDTGGGIATEQCALRAAQHLYPVKVEHREALEDGIFEHHIVLNEADRPRRSGVENGRSEERRVGKEGVSTCRSRGSL